QRKTAGGDDKLVHTTHLLCTLRRRDPGAVALLIFSTAAARARTVRLYFDTALLCRCSSLCRDRPADGGCHQDRSHRQDQNRRELRAQNCSQRQPAKDQVFSRRLVQIPPEREEK